MCSFVLFYKYITTSNFAVYALMKHDVKAYSLSFITKTEGKRGKKQGLILSCPFSCGNLTEKSVSPNLERAAAVKTKINNIVFVFNGLRNV